MHDRKKIMKEMKDTEKWESFAGRHANSVTVANQINKEQFRAAEIEQQHEETHPDSTPRASFVRSRSPRRFQQLASSTTAIELN